MAEEKYHKFYDSVEDAAAQAVENEKVDGGLTPLPAPFLSGLKLEADVQLGDLTLNTIDENGVVWVMTDIENWWRQPDPRLPSLQRGWGDGEYDAEGRYNARVITLSGSFLTQDSSQLAAARDKLVKATNLVRKGDWLVVKETPIPKAAFVRLSGSPSIETVTARGRTNFSIGFKAADPIKYEWVGGADNFRSSGLTSGGVTVKNEGNTNVTGVFQVFGPVTASVDSPAEIVKTTGEGGSIKIIDSLTSNQILEIDTLNREVLLLEGNTVLSGRFKTATLLDWIYLDPGENTLSYSGAGSCRLLYRSGWIG
jgi:hypothetical protein